MLQITREDVRWGAVTLKVMGRLAQDLASLLEQECSVLHLFSDGLTLDLSGVTYVDRCGVQALRRLHDTGCAVYSCSDPVASILEAEGIRSDCCGGPPPA